MNARTNFSKKVINKKTIEMGDLINVLHQHSLFIFTIVALALNKKQLIFFSFQNEYLAIYQFFIIQGSGGTERRTNGRRR